MGMKIRILKNTLVCKYDHRLDETYDVHFKRWDEIYVDSIIINNGNAQLINDEGDVYEEIPINVFEICK